VVEYCSKCGFPNTRPGIIFQGGVCQACINYEKRKDINWIERGESFRNLLTNFRGKSRYDCLIPVSGGKDSHFLVKTMTDAGMNPLLVTVTDSFSHTIAGTHNLRNLIEKFNLNHWQYTISHDLFRRATRAAFEKTGEALKFVEYAIYTIPVRLAQAFGIPLVVYGENSAYEYGSTDEDNYVANPQILKMIEQVNEERPWWSTAGISSQEIDSILPIWKLRQDNPLVIYTSHFFPWSSVKNLDIARKIGFKDLDDTKEWVREGTIEQFEQIDSVAYMVHLWLKYHKFGFQRVADIASRRVREGLLKLEDAKKLVKEKDPILDKKAKEDFCKFCGYSGEEFDEIVKMHWRNDVR
jgi:N-acetyl sugar amidotransferase